MTERQYSETEVRAMRAAVLRQAAEIALKYTEETADRAYFNAMQDFRKSILALIDPPDDDALNAMIAAAYEAACTLIDAYSEYDQHMCCTGRECGCQGATVHQEMKHYMRGLTPADALAALERVKQAERERGFDLGFAASCEGWNGEYPGDAQETEYYREKRAAAIRGESE